ncbi:MAG TPA: hypothetical protein VNO55_02710 [Polyangia bacterium]|nr:hypothetical protein [Polyangia bacterium]
MRCTISSAGARLVLLALACLGGCGGGQAPAAPGPVDGGGPGPADAAPPPATTDGDLPGSCGQVRCETPPANRCEGDVLKTFYDPNGTCQAGVCSYRYTMQTCPHGCQAGQCLQDDCDGGTCGPPGGMPGMCDGGACDAGGCSSPQCQADPCSQVQCNAPPPNQCDGSMLKTYYDPNGTCSAGTCSYRFTTSACPRGCQDGKCITVSCLPGSASFTADVTDLASLQTVGPLPALAGGAGYEIRSYMQVKDSYAGVRVPIYAPANMTIQASVHYHDPLHDPADADYQGEWGLMFEASCTTQISFAHIREVVQKIADVTVTSGSSAGELVSHPVDFLAGEIIGYYKRGPGYFAWDFVVTDSSVTNQFINMPRYVDGQLKFLHAICPYDPYPSQMRQPYLDLLGTNNDPPTVGRKCGTVAHDRAGTIAGVWFHAPYTGGGADAARSASGNPLSVFRAETDAVYLADLDGDTTTVGFETFRIDPTNPTYRDPETVTSSYCYERRTTPTAEPSGWAYFNLASATELHVAYAQQGGCPPTFPATGVRTYYR